MGDRAGEIRGGRGGMRITDEIICAFFIVLLVLTFTTNVISAIWDRRLKREHEKLLKRREFLKKELESMKGRSE